jgi:hypothetical protein
LLLFKTAAEFFLQFLGLGLVSSPLLLSDLLWYVARQEISAKPYEVISPLLLLL